MIDHRFHCRPNRILLKSCVNCKDSGVFCDKWMPIAVNGKVYKTMVRPVMIYGADAWTLRRSEEGLLERTEMRMLRLMLGITPPRVADPSPEGFTA